MQIPGEGLRVPARTFRNAIARSSTLQRLMQSYAFTLLNQVEQLAACNHFHDVEQRCARWILMVQDRIPGYDFPLTQEVLSLMLGVRRSSVTVAAGRLSDAGLIEYRRGNVTITRSRRTRAALMRMLPGHPARIRKAAGKLAIARKKPRQGGECWRGRWTRTPIPRNAHRRAHVVPPSGALLRRVQELAGPKGRQ